MLVCSYQEQRIATTEADGNPAGAVYDRRLPPAPSPPTHSRLPPDGHEFPATYTDSIPPTGGDKSTNPTSSFRYLPHNLHSRSHSRSRSRDGRDPGGSSTPPFGGSTSLMRTSSLSSRWRRQDEKSEKSVRDKIAMFSQSKAKKLEGSEDDTHDDAEDEVTHGFSEADIRTSAQNGSPIPKLSKTSTFSSMINVSSSQNQETVRGCIVKPASSEIDVSRNINARGNVATPASNQQSISRQEIVEHDPVTPTPSDSDQAGLAHRSQSLIDIDRTTRGKRHSVGAYDRPSHYQYHTDKSEDRDRRTSLANLIELRRKSVSKLRGLVIPESKPGEISSRPPIDLPRIGSSPPPPPTTNVTSVTQKTSSLPRDVNRSQRLYKTDSISSIESCESNTSKQSSTISSLSWKTQNSTSTISKFSPAVKRKGTALSRPDSLPPVGSRLTRSCSPANEAALISPQKQSSDGFVSLNSDIICDNETGRYGIERSLYSKLPLVSKSCMDSRMNRSEDSDNDSAVSSTQSSFSQGITPPTSPVPDSSDLDESRSSMRSNRISHSPQCSIDEMDPKRVLKTGTIEAENRWNVIKSAKCSSGRSSDEHSTPELSRKSSVSKKDSGFSHRLESDVRDCPTKSGLRRQSSADSTSTLASSRRSSQDSRRNSKDSVIHVPSRNGDVQLCAEQVYFDKQGDMYKESEIKVAYVNEITDNFEQVSESTASLSNNIVAELPMSGDFTDYKSMNPKGKDAPSEDRWAALELKYGKSSKNDIESKISKLRSSDSPLPPPDRIKVVDRKPNQRKTAVGGGGFKALAEKWKQRAEVEEDAPPAPWTPPVQGSPMKPIRQEEVVGSVIIREQRPSTLQLSRADVPDRKLSMPEFGSGGVRMRDRRSEGSNPSCDMPSRPSSLIENCTGDPMIQSLEPETTYLSPCSPAASGSTDSLDENGSLSRTTSKEVLEAFSKPRPLGQFVTVGGPGSRMGSTSAGTPRVSDIMRAFEYKGLGGVSTTGASGSSSHPRVSSMDSAASDDGSFGGHYGSVTSLASGTRDQYGSITSLASSTSIISSQELAQLIEEANQSLEESGTPSHEILVVVLHRELATYGSVGITLAGGADYETREVTVHKIIPGSLADRDGRIQKGDRVLSINGKTLRGVTHREALTILKSPRPEVVMVLSRSRSVTPQEGGGSSSVPHDHEGGYSNSCHTRSAIYINHMSSRPPKILESPMDSKSLMSDLCPPPLPRGPPMHVILVKDGAGLGFSLEGGKDSPLGDRPLTVKKIFAGGSADKGGLLQVGDELLSVNGVDLTVMARIEAWNFLKKLPDGSVNIVIRQKLLLQQQQETTSDVSSVGGIGASPATVTLTTTGGSVVTTASSSSSACGAGGVDTLGSSSIGGAGQIVDGAAVVTVLINKSEADKSLEN